jgi:radical SAM protein with 4Fe4S-binding SPASM domain
MENIDTLRILKSTIGNPLVRLLLSGFGYCDTCQKNRVEVALEVFTGTKTDACIKCRFAEKILRTIIKTGGNIFGVSEDELHQKFSNPSWRKGLANVITGIVNFGIRRPFVSGAPFLVVWDVTNKCNLRCKHCYANAGDNSGKSELSTSQAKQVIDKLSKASVPIIAFSGGEPLVRPDIFELIRYAKEQGIYVAVATNGTLITTDVAERLKELDVGFVQISLDGASSETHDEFRGIPGVYNRTLQGIKNCVQKGLFVNIATTATKMNYSEIPRIYSLAETLNVNWFMIYNFIPTGRGKFISNNDLSPVERETLLHDLWGMLKKDSTVNVLSTAPQFARVALESEFGQNEKIIPTHFSNPSLSGRLVNLADFIGGCGCGRFYCAIRSNGDIEPCVFFPLKIGNIFEDDFQDLWVSNKTLNELRNKDLLEGNCGKCEYRYFCGGCRARAYGYTGNYLSPDPGCIKNKIESTHYIETAQTETVRYKKKLTEKYRRASVKSNF